MALAAGTRLGPYLIVSPAGAGGMGEVYRARDTRLDRTVAVKILPPQFSSSPQLKQQFEREAKAASSLSHPYICHVYDVGSDAGIDFFVMEYVEGETLAQRLQRGALPLEQVLKIAVEIADALDKAHRHGLVHRDLKPSNIMLTRSGAKLMDFGLAKPVGPVVSAAASTTTGAVTPSTPTVTMAALSAPVAQGRPESDMVGTLPYMAPEVLRGAEADARSDIFAFGCVLYEMVTRRRGFDGKSQLSVLTAILENDPEPVISPPPLAPDAVQRVITACLAKDPEQRFQTAHDLNLTLGWLRASILAPRPARRRLSPAAPWIVTITLMVLAAVGWGLFFVAHSREGPAPAVIRLTVSPPNGVKLPEGEGVPGSQFAISPDAGRIVFQTINAQGQTSLWVQSFAAHSAEALAGTENAEYPFWSPDGNYIGFFAAGKLQKIPAMGGVAEILCDAPGAVGGTWNRNGVILFGSRTDTANRADTSASSGSGSVMRVPETGGTPTAVTRPASPGIGHLYPEFLPDGRHFLYLAFTPEPAGRAIYVGSLDSPESTRVVSTPFKGLYASGYLLFARNRFLMAQRFSLDPPRLTGDPVVVAASVSAAEMPGQAAFDASPSGTLAYRGGPGLAETQLTWYSRGGQPTAAVSTSTLDVSVFLAPDQARVAVSRATGPEAAASSVPPLNVWVTELERGTSLPITFGNGGYENPIWSPDGTRLVYASHQKGSAQILLRNATGSEAEQVLYAGAGNPHPIAWSPDQSSLLLNLMPAGGAVHLAILPLNGAKKIQPLTDSSFNSAQGQFSPDGRWIVYTSDESGEYQIYIRRFGTNDATKWQVSIGGGTQPRWRSDGREIFFVAPDRTLMATPVKPGPSPVIGRPAALFKLPIYPPTDLLFYGGAPDYDVSRDGRRFLVNRTLRPSPPIPIDVVVNWPSQIKSR